MSSKTTRRAFCRSCMTAGAALIAGKALAEDQIDAKVKVGGESLDYSIIGYCGYRCDLCVGRSGDQALRRKMVEGWRKLFGHTTYTETNIPIAQPCAGCKGIGEVADKVCKARGCAQSKNLVSCADCDEFPCPKVGPLLSDRNRLLFTVRGKDVSREEYEWSAMQFESLPVLFRRMSETGKMPAWVKEIL